MVLKFFECEKPIAKQISGQVFKYGIWDPHNEVTQLTLLTERHSFIFEMLNFNYLLMNLFRQKKKIKKSITKPPHSKQFCLEDSHAQKTIKLRLLDETIFQILSPKSYIKYIKSIFQKIIRLTCKLIQNSHYKKQKQIIKQINQQINKQINTLNKQIKNQENKKIDNKQKNQIIKIKNNQKQKTKFILEKNHNKLPFTYHASRFFLNF
ncbi:hypothetical protein TTHERM_000328629 (macronuclear) [Tetrahymena thermophila SB210]|uniref:Uncharacterized protein n=1 Tax=Tetrahymena thermophila (strain SB210) TaxID=312017 RepID=W7XEZ8_TETTS|nr:hypothetical protein TTHERM_000328629 [Tetrahymena thermophila SB210]EWS71324.1 hypothetical protein TTHERM_000328629 [Tetrahymena thermophila SB210]|eukprot:XP_012656142.1 hypothetical protein TTHERM_000328629 [Tetrahymena thermophila SB210]